MKKYVAIAAVVLALGVVGCSPVTDTAPPNSTPSDTPTQPAEATPEQIASVVAEHDTAWRDVAANVTECHVMYVLRDKLTAVQHATAAQCFQDEIRTTASAMIAYVDLDSFVVPSTMASIVEKTRTALEPIAATNIGVTVCGSGDLPDLDREACISAMATLGSAYKDLVPVLDAWKPYL